MCVCRSLSPPSSPSSALSPNIHLLSPSQLSLPFQYHAFPVLHEPGQHKRSLQPVTKSGGGQMAVGLTSTNAGVNNDNEFAGKFLRINMQMPVTFCIQQSFPTSVCPSCLSRHRSKLCGYALTNIHTNTHSCIHACRFHHQQYESGVREG